MARKLKTVITILITLSLAGCFPSPVPPPATIRYYAVDYPAPTVMKKWEGKTSLKIDSITSLPPFTGQEMVWQDTSYTREVLRRQRWQMPPTVMVEHLLLRDFKHALPALIVLSREDSEPGRFTLEGKITEFLGGEREGALFCRVAITLNLLDREEKDHTKRVVWQKAYKAEERLSSRSPLEMARGMSIALEKISQAILADLGSAMEVRSRP